MTSTPSSSTSRAISYFTERAEDAQAALLGVLGGGSGGSGPGGAQGPSGADRYLAQVDVAGGAAGDQGLQATRNKLESSAEHERIEGLRTVVAMISKSLPAADHLFPSVLKLTSVQSMQVKTLVYLVTLRLAPSQPDVALLSINSFQRDLADSSPLIRGMALRVLSSLGVKMAASIIEMAIARSVRDASFYVRRIAADAIAKCSELAPSLLPSLIPHLSTLLADKHPSVLGSALLAFTCTVPQRYELLHSHFRRICHALVDVDEWNQPAALRLLASYARLNLARPSEEAARAVEDPRSEKKVPGRTKWGTGLDADLELLLTKTQPLLSSRNSASVLSAAHLYLALLPVPHPSHTQLIQPLLRLTRSHPTQALPALHFIRALISLRPDLFSHSPSISNAFVPLSTLAGEPVYVSKAKLDVLVDLALASTEGEGGAAVSLALDELEEAALHRPEAALKAHATRGLGRLATTSDQTGSNSGSSERVAERCTQVLLSILKSSPTSSAQKGKRSGDAPSGEADSRAVQRAVEVLRTIVRAKASAPASSEGNAASSNAAGLLVYTLSQLLFKAEHVDPATSKSTSTASASSSSSSSSAKLTSKSSIHDPQARATLFWVMGQYCQLQVPVTSRLPSTTITNSATHLTIPLSTTILPDILRKCALNFAAESNEAKLAVLTFAAKLTTVLSGQADERQRDLATSVRLLYAYILDLARYDSCVDVRDRARFLRGLTAGLKAPAGKGATEAGAGAQGEDEEEAQTSGGGVRLRREQVMKVLFNERPGGGLNAAAATKGEGAVDGVDKKDVDPALLLDPARLALLPVGSSPLHLSSRTRGSRHRPDEGAGLPAWTSDPSLLPPSSVRDHVVAAPAAEPVALLRENVSQGGWASPHGQASPGAAAAAGMAAVAAPQGKGKYKDLDAFLDEESSEGEEEESEEESESSEEEDEEEESSEEDIDEEGDEDEEDEEESEEEEQEGGTFLGHDDDARRSTNAWAD